MGYYKITQWAEGDYRLGSAEAVFEELLVGEEKALLFDTGWGLGPLYKTVREITDKPLLLVNSHGHLDHVNGNGQFGEPIHIHPRDIELAKVHGSAAFRNRILQTVEGGNFIPEGFDRERYLTEENLQYIPVEDGQVFDLGGKTLKVVELPGHTGGSIGLLYQEKGVLFVGDAVNGFLLMVEGSATVSEYIQSLQRAKGLNLTGLVASHKEEVLAPNMLEKYLYLAQNVNWEEAQPYLDPNDPNAVPNPDVRVMCTEGMTLKDRENPEFACIVFSKKNLG